MNQIDHNLFINNTESLRTEKKRDTFIIRTPLVIKYKTG